MILNGHSYYSLRYGTFSEETLLELAQQAGYGALALTDINTTSAILNFFRVAGNFDIKPLAGIDFRNGAEQLYVGIARSNEGFMQMNRFLSEHLHHKRPLPEQAPELEDVYFIYPFEQVLKIEKTYFTPNEKIGVGLSDLRKIAFNKLIHQKELWVMLLPCSFRNKLDYNLHRLLRSVDNNILLSQLREDQQGNKDEVMLSKNKAIKAFTDFPHIITNTQALIESCETTFKFKEGHQNKKKFTDSKAKDSALLRKLCNENLPKRYAEITPDILARIEKELKMIEKMDFVPFFLVNWDIIRYARSKNYYHVGRGSGANSIVAYLLYITDVDPIDLNLYFERFMNDYRTNPPDFDIDFSWRDREDVTQYIFDTYGKNGEAALLATYSTFKHSAAIRELGKVFGLPKHEIDKLSAGKFDPTTLDGHSKLVFQYSQKLQGMPNLRNIHAGGILISHQSMHYFTATDLPPKGFPTTHFDMHIAEDVGLYKYDILGQRGLGKIKDAVRIAEKNHPEMEPIDIHNIKSFKEDKQINEMVSRGDCMGCFYVESPAMRMLLTKLRVKDYLGLVAASSIIRPGVAKSGMMKEYIVRHRDNSKIDTHPILLDILSETYGIMVYQEDVIKVAHYFANLDFGEADVLRRGMSGKFRSRAEFEKVQAKYFENCKARGFDDELSRTVWEQIRSFAGYAFAKGHSASYAVESYQSLYLKKYFPLEYMVATLNNGGGFYPPEFYVHEARMKGGNIHAPDINLSAYETVIYGKDIYLGFAFLHNLPMEVAERIVRERQNGKFTSFHDFMERVPIGLETLDILIRIDAFRFTGKNKKNLLWEARLVYEKNNAKKKPQPSLFKPKPKNFDIPDLPVKPLEEAFDQIELLGFPLQSSFNLLAKKPKDYIMARDMKKYLHQNVTMLGHLVTVKATTTSRGDRMNFGTFVDEDGAWIDTVHFPPVAAQYKFTGPGIYKLQGKLIQEFDFISLEIYAMERLPYIQDVRYFTKTG